MLDVLGVLLLLIADWFGWLLSYLVVCWVGLTGELFRYGWSGGNGGHDLCIMWPAVLLVLVIDFRLWFVVCCCVVRGLWLTALLCRCYGIWCGFSFCWCGRCCVLFGVCVDCFGC